MCLPSLFHSAMLRGGPAVTGSTTGDFVNSLTRNMALAMAIAVLASACTTTPAPEFGGKWRPVNRFADTTREIPLNPAYIYYALPMDGTLRGVLARWARDTHAGLSWQLSSDYTLPTAVGQIRTPDANAAMQQLAQVYAAQRIELAVENGAITARPAKN